MTIQALHKLIHLALQLCEHGDLQIDPSPFQGRPVQPPMACEEHTGGDQGYPGAKRQSQNSQVSIRNEVTCHEEQVECHVADNNSHKRTNRSEPTRFSSPLDYFQRLFEIHTKLLKLRVGNACVLRDQIVA